mmetsp:Transcript_68584/g.135637  ORF Transcript_68584/g.135637 Transcript_68584/m.135637 type:complete len:574 (-) Transcript_68584:164-1885(-)
MGDVQHSWISSAAQLLPHWCWLQALRMYSWLWPIQVHHHWSETSASLVVLLPTGSPASSLGLFQITDAHISKSPLQPEEIRYASRMHQAFETVASRTNGSFVRPAGIFRELVDLAALAVVDVAILSGDILNFPQAHAALWVTQTLNSSLHTGGRPIPFLYCAGNHDWFYEGSQAEQWQLQREWRQTTLHPLYASSASWQNRGAHQRFDVGAFEVRGLLLVVIDNSRYQITADQLSFFQAQTLRWLPMVLVVHVPLSVPQGLSPLNGFPLCGDPAWGASVDRWWQMERRRPWPETGSGQSTALFLEAVQAAASPRGPLIAVLAGHVHQQHVSPIHPEAAHTDDIHTVEANLGWGAKQYVSLPAFNGGHRILQVQIQAKEAHQHESTRHTTDEEALRQRVGRLHHAQQQARSFVMGITAKASGVSDQPRVAAVAWQSWGGMNGVEHVARKVDPSRIMLALETMLYRTEVSIRHGFQALAMALTPLLEQFMLVESLKPAKRTVEALLVLFSSALPIWADPPQLVYQPGEELSLKHGCSIMESLNSAVVAWKSHGDWEGLGAGLVSSMQDTICAYHS